MRNQTAYMRCAPSSSRTRTHLQQTSVSIKATTVPAALFARPKPNTRSRSCPSPLLPSDRGAGLPVASSCLLSCLSPDFLFLSAPKIGAEAKALCPRTYPAPLLGKKDEIRWKGIQKRSHNRRSNGSFEIQGDSRDHQHGCGQCRSGRPEAVQ